ncbi:uncharacterized protein BDV17DRAFT_269105 [Aspergillus undulatus]|uniref:uncharacterized protein n=1 Tax=Aspergillus undulatus TaxID=1810928 RepID=UPI003CCCED95
MYITGEIAMIRKKFVGLIHLPFQDVFSPLPQILRVIERTPWLQLFFYMIFCFVVSIILEEGTL